MDSNPSFSSSSTGTTNSSINANPSFDFDNKMAPETNDVKVGNGSNGSSSFSVSNSETEEEGFVSGEEEFETPPPGDPEEKTLELPVKEGEIVHEMVEQVTGSSESSSSTPKSQVFSGNDGVVESPVVVVAVEASRFEEEREIENGGLFKNSSEVEENTGNLELELGSMGMVGDVNEASDEVVKGRKEDGLLENAKSDGVVEFAGGTEGKEAIASEDGGVSVVDTEELTREEQNVGSDTKENAGLSVIIEERVDTKLVEADTEENLKNERNSAEEIDEQVSRVLGGGGSEELDENKVPEIESSELDAERTVNLGIGPEEVSDIVENPNYLKSIDVDIGGSKEDGSSAATHVRSEQILEPVTNSIGHESKSEGEIIENDHDDMNGGSVGENVYIHPDSNSQKPEVEIEQKTNLRDKLNGLMPNSAGDGVEYESNGAIDGMDETETADSSFNSEKLNPVESGNQEDELLDSMQVHAGEGCDLYVAVESYEIEEEGNTGPGYKEDNGVSFSDKENKVIHFKGSELSKLIMEKLTQEAGESSRLGAESSHGQIFMESDEELDTDEEGEGKELFDSAALTALLEAATGARSEGGGTVMMTSSDGSGLLSLERPTGLGSSSRSLKPAPRPNRPNLFTPPDLADERDSDDKLSDEEKKKLEKIQLIRVKFLRLIGRVGHSPAESIAAQVLYRLVIASGRHTSQAFSLEAAKATAIQLEAGSADGKNDLDFSLNILVLGKTGVGKSATINSILGLEKSVVNAFEPATTSVKEIIGTLDGVKIRVFDTPGLRSSLMEQAFNQRILSSVKKLMKKCPPDILLYVDRLDIQTRDLNDLPLLRTITSTLGSSIWKSAIVTLTHAASAPPDGPSGYPLSYEVLVAQRSHMVQQAIGRAVGDLRMMNPSLMNPVSLVENHPSCRRNREGQKVLPNGQIWQSQLLLLCYSLKILAEVSSLTKPQDPFDHCKLFGFRVRSPPLPYLLSSLLHSWAHPKLPTDQGGGENIDSDIDLDDLSDSDQEDEEDEYDQLPPFKPLRKSQIAKLSKDQRKEYFDEYDYRVKLLQKKQWKEELQRSRDMKKRGKSGVDNQGFISKDADQENEGPAAVPVPLPDMVLPPSFDGDNPAYRYRFLEPTSQLLARPVLDTHGWDHDCGYDGLSLEGNLAIAGRFPAGLAVQITKDKKEFNIHMDSSIAAKHGENGSTLAGFDVQNVGKQLAYIVKAETKFKNLKKNKTAGGISVTFLGENVVTGLKLEDQIAIGKHIMLVGSTGTVRSQGDVAYGANLEARLKEKDYPIGQDQSTLGLSLMRWRSDLAVGANLQSQFSVGRSSKVSVRLGLNNKMSGQITVRTSSSEQLQLALVGVLPIAMAIYRSIFPAAGESYSAY